jgi:hypothetical protein
MLARPLPPLELRHLDEDAPVFIPAPEVVDWLRASFIGPDAEHPNPDHEHLIEAEIGVLWTNAYAKRQMREIAGMCEAPAPRGLPWIKARQEAQLREWFGEEAPDFIITLSAPYAANCSDVDFCALVEHECYHAAQQVGADGELRFSQSTGRPLYGIRDHDINGFLGVARRYGPVEPGVAELVEILKRRPEVSAASIAAICGTCRGAA